MVVQETIKVTFILIKHVCNIACGLLPVRAKAVRGLEKSVNKILGSLQEESIRKMKKCNCV